MINTVHLWRENALIAQIVSHPRKTSVTKIIQRDSEKGILCPLHGLKMLRMRNKKRVSQPSAVLAVLVLILISGIVQDSSVCDVTAPFVRFCCMFIYFALPTVLLSSSPLQPTRIHSTPLQKNTGEKPFQS